LIGAALAAGLLATSIPAIAMPVRPHLAPAALVSANLPAVTAGSDHSGVILAQYYYHRHYRHCWWHHGRRYCR